MTQPTPYRRGYDFSDAGGATPPGGPLDGELDDIGLTVSQILRNLALIQRDDTALRNGIVGIDALDNRVLGLLSGGTFTIAGTWATATSYAAGAFFSDDEAIYLTMEAHTSVSIVDDLATGHIVKVLQNEQGERLRDDFTGDGVTTVFNLSQSPSRPADVEVYVEGLLVPAAAYAQTGATVTFDVAPTNGDKVSIFSITWSTTPPIQTLIDAVGDRNTEISAATQFIEDIASTGEALGAAMVAFEQSGAGTVDRTAQARLRDTAHLPDYTSFQAAIDGLAARGNKLSVPSGKTTLAAGLLIEREDVSLNGASQKSSEIEADHNGSAVKFEAQVINLPDGKFAMSDLYITKKTGNALVSGYPAVGFVGTAIELAGMFCGDVQRVQVDRFGVGLDLSSVYMSTFNQFFARNCWMGLKCSTPIDGVTTGNIFTGGCFNNSAFDLTNGEKFTFLGTDFEASSTTCVVSSRNQFINCRFERMSLNRAFFTWLDIQGDFNKLVGSQFFWDNATSPSDEATQFYVQIAGDYNEIEAQKLYTSRNFVKLTSASAGNTVLFNAPFTDYANTGNNNLYRRSGRLFIDQGARNRIIFDNADGRVEVTGTDSMVASGNLSNFLRYDPLSNLVINAATLTVAQSDIAGPCGIPASHVDNKKFTIASVASTIRGRTPDLATADGTKVYSIGCFVYIPSGGTQPTKVRIGDGSGTFTDIYPADGTDRWHWVPVFTQPANTNAVQLMIEAEGEVSDVFYVALPSVSEGNIPAYVPAPRSKTSWTDKTIAKHVTSMIAPDEVQISGIKVVGAQGAAVADATDAASAITQLNALLARCRAHGLIAT